MRLKIMEWNLNFKSNNRVKIEDFIKDKVEEYEIIIFTEIVNNDSVLDFMNKLNKYNFYESYNTEGNQVIIAIRRNIKVTKVISKMPKVSLDNSPNFLNVQIVVNGTRYEIIGTRICISDESEEDFKERRKQFEYLSNYISDLENVIILGDFNNGYIRGDINKKFINVKSEYYKINKDGNIPNTRFFCYQMMRDMIGEDFSIYTPEDKYSWGLSYNEKNNSFKYGYIKDDHLITSNNIVVAKYDYNWDFVNENRDKYITKGPYVGKPDHAYLVAEIDL